MNEYAECTRVREGVAWVRERVAWVREGVAWVREGVARVRAAGVGAARVGAARVGVYRNPGEVKAVLREDPVMQWIRTIHLGEGLRGDPEEIVFVEGTQENLAGQV